MKNKYLYFIIFYQYAVFDIVGEVGNWKKWFTVAQSEQFDGIWNTEMEGYDMFKFKYSA